MAAAMVTGGLLLSASAAQAATLTVTDHGDGGGAACPGSNCTLRAAVNAAASGDTIVLPSGTITLATGPLQVNTNVTIAGQGAGATTITASPASGLIQTSYSELTLSGLTLANGSAAGSSGGYGRGGAINQDYGTVKIVNCALTNNTATAGTSTTGNSGVGEPGYGGAIYGYGKLVIVNSTFSGNIAKGGSGGGTFTSGGNPAPRSNYGAQGGAIYYEGSVTISSSMFSGNTAEGGATNPSAMPANGSYGSSGGALYLYYATAQITSSTFSGNTAGGGGTGAAGTRGGSGGYGGAIYNNAGTRISNSTISGNTAAAGADAGTSYGYAGWGGGLYDYQSLTLDGATVNNNVAAADAAGHNGAFGGGLYGGGTEVVLRSTFSGNQAPGQNAEGGGILSDGYALDAEQSTISGNTSYDGAGLYVGEQTNLTNVTISGNTAADEGGGIYNDATSDLANVTLVGNAAQYTGGGGGGNLYLEYYTLRAHDTLIAGGTAPVSGGNCGFNSSAILQSNGYNAEDHNQCMLGLPTDRVNASLALGPLQSNGGPTQTIALMPGSQAIDAGDPSGCTDADGNPLGVDQRGLLRPSGSRCDIGAFEYQYPPPSPPPPPPPVAAQDSALTLSPTSFAAQTRGASIAKPHQGTTVSYSDTQAALTTFTVLKVVKGYRVGHGSCKARPKHGKLPKHSKSCTLFVNAGSFSHQDGAGANRFHFTGRVGGHALSKGSYELAATPKLGTLVGAPRVAAFRIV